jgi:hypothetical protein
VRALEGGLTRTGTFEYEEYISLKSINDPNEGYVLEPPAISTANTAQVRDHLGSDDPTGPDRCLSEAHIFAFPKRRKQRMSDISLGTFGTRELWHLQVHYKHATRHAYQ